MRIDLYFYKTSSDNEPVRDWLIELPKAERQLIGLDLQRVQYRWPVGMPLCKHLGNGLWEVRTNLQDGKISRVFICFHDGDLYALHAIIKKTQKTPKSDLDLALKRMKEVLNG